MNDAEQINVAILEEWIAGRPGQVSQLSNSEQLTAKTNRYRVSSSNAFMLGGIAMYSNREEYVAETLQMSLFVIRLTCSDVTCN